MDYKIKILIVDDLKMIRESLSEMLKSQPEFLIAGHAQNGREAIKQIELLKPDIVLMDVLMPIMGGIEATSEISLRFPSVKVIIISSFKFGLTLTEALSAGAKGYILKNLKDIELKQAIHSAYSGSGSACFSPRLTSDISIHQTLIAKQQQLMMKNMQNETPDDQVVLYSDTEPDSNLDNSIIVIKNNQKQNFFLRTVNELKLLVFALLKIS